MPTIGIALATDKDRYTPGEPIRAELTVFNRSGRPAVLKFTTGQRYDFIVERGEGVPVWRWSDGQGFIQSLGEEAIGPAREEIVFGERFPAPSAPGRYRLTGRLTASGVRLAAALWVIVE